MAFRLNIGHAEEASQALLSLSRRCRLSEKSNLHTAVFFFFLLFRPPRRKYHLKKEKKNKGKEENLEAEAEVKFYFYDREIENSL